MGGRGSKAGGGGGGGGATTAGPQGATSGPGGAVTADTRELLKLDNENTLRKELRTLPLTRMTDTEVDAAARFLNRDTPRAGDGVQLRNLINRNAIGSNTTAKSEIRRRNQAKPVLEAKQNLNRTINRGGRSTIERQAAQAGVPNPKGRATWKLRDEILKKRFGTRRVNEAEAFEKSGN